MIVHLRHHDIDPVAWDQRLEACSNASWYGLSSTLEAAAPGGWDALVDETTGEQMPLFWRRKYGVSYLYQPFMISIQVLIHLWMLQLLRRVSYVLFRCISAMRISTC